MTRYCPTCQVSWADTTPTCWSCASTNTTTTAYQLTPSKPATRVIDWRNPADWTPGDAA